MKQHTRQFTAAQDAEGVAFKQRISNLEFEIANLPLLYLCAASALFASLR